MKYQQIESEEQLNALYTSKEQLEGYAFQNVDFRHLTAHPRIHNCLFLGCHLPPELQVTLDESNMIFPHIQVPFNLYRRSLYSREELFANYTQGQPLSYQNTLDYTIYQHYLSQGKETEDIKETLSRRLHDHAMSDALYGFIRQYDERKVVAFMGGHHLSRADYNYKMVARISKTLTEKGYLMISGGGPGAMEATHVGAWMAGKTKENLEEVLDLIAEAPLYTDKLWLDKAFEALALYPNSDYESIGIPTWLYGHEPPTPFAHRIAKYFANSVREDGLLTLAKGGIIFAPGSAGTIQEIFQDLTQNHYLSFGYASPMIFFNKEYWTKDRPIYPLIKQLSDEQKFKNLILSICDEEDEVLAELHKFSQG